MAAQDLLSVSVEQIDDSIIVRPVGELDMSSVSLFADSLRRAFEKRRAGPISLDLTNVSFIDCRGLRALIMADRRARGSGYCLRIKCGEPVRRLVETTHARIAC